MPDVSPREASWQVVEHDGAFGYADADGTIVLAAQFEAARPFVAGRAAVRVDTRWGFIDAQGARVVAPSYDEVGDFSADGRWAAVRRDGLWGLIEREGVERIVPRYEALGPPSGGMIAVSTAGRWGYVELASGREAITARFDDAGPFMRDAAAVRDGEDWRSIDRHGGPIDAETFRKPQPPSAWRRSRPTLARAAAALIGFHIVHVVLLWWLVSSWLTVLVEPPMPALVGTVANIGWFIVAMLAYGYRQRTVAPRAGIVFWSVVTALYTASYLLADTAGITVRTRMRLSTSGGLDLSSSREVIEPGIEFYLQATAMAPTWIGLVMLGGFVLHEAQRYRWQTI